MKELIDKLYLENNLDRESLLKLLEDKSEETDLYLFEKAREVQASNFGKDIFIRGLIEVSSFCKNDCLYCGIRKSNKAAERYRLKKDQILECCHTGYELGFRTFVLQGGEDNFFDDNLIEEIVCEMKNKYSDCAITLSLGEKSMQSYKKFFDAGADRYLLRHETANKEHYEKLHPQDMSFEKRQECLRYLRSIGYQVGCGIMVGSPYQTKENLVEDLIYMKNFKPHMVGIGPFIPHHKTPFASEKAGSLEMTLKIIAITRLLLPQSLIPSTTALSSIDEKGREKGILAGANVVMPNLSPKEVREKYLLYDNKLHSGNEAAESLNLLKKQIESIGYSIKIGRGDHKEKVAEKATV